MRVEHTFEPVCDSHSCILILGSIPSVKSRENAFYYGHPRNRFWEIIARLTGENLPGSVEEKKSLLYRNHIALWDVIASCDIEGSSDSSIRNVVPNDLSLIFREAPIQKIFANGNTAYRLYQRYSMEQTGKDIVKLPSTSPANAGWQTQRLVQYWKESLQI